MSSSKKIERFELRLRPNIAAESALLASLEAKDGVYGGKTELLRECVRRGYLALLEMRSKLPQDAPEDDILKAFAAEFSASGYSYRIGKLFLDAIDAVSNVSVQSDEMLGEAAVPGSRAMAAAAAQENAPATLQAPATSAAEASPALQTLARVEVPVTPETAVVPEGETPETPEAPEAIEEAAPEGRRDAGSDAPEPSARPRVNWGSRLGGLAGSGDAGTKKK